MSLAAVIQSWPGPVIAEENSQHCGVWEMMCTNYCSRVLEQCTVVPKQLKWSSSETWEAPRFILAGWVRARGPVQVKIPLNMCFKVPLSGKSGISDVYLSSCPVLMALMHVVDLCDRLTGYIHPQRPADRETVTMQRNWLTTEGMHWHRQSNQWDSDMWASLTCTQKTCEWECSKEIQ